MRIVIAGPGRAGTSLGLAAERAGHEVLGALVNTTPSKWATLDWGTVLPEADLLLVAVRDEAIDSVAERLEPISSPIAVAAHLSGFTPVTALRPLREVGVAIGGIHPLQSLPDADTGSAALAGSYAGIDGDQLAIDTLTHLATSLEMIPFHLDDVSRPAYHAAAAAASNFVVAALAVSADLYESAGIDPKVSRPLVEQAMANVFDKGAAASLTGPIARGDVETVVGHLAAAKDVSEHVGRQFQLMAEATALRAGREEDLKRWK